MNLEYIELLNDFSSIEKITESTDILFLKKLNNKIHNRIPLTRWIDIYNWRKAHPR